MSKCTYIVFPLFLSAPLPNLTSDDIDSALAPAATQGNNHTRNPFSLIIVFDFSGSWFCKMFV